MKVAKITAYGGVENIVFADVPDPVAKADEAVVRVVAAPVTAGDARIRSGRVPRGFGLILRLAFGWNAPRNPVQGWSFAGINMATGARVFGISGIKGGAHAEQVCLNASRLIAMPEEMSFPAAAAFWFGGLTGAEAVYDNTVIGPGTRVLINGATGAVGSAALQMAAAQGAIVTAVCSAANAGLARDLGATQVIDYRSQAIVGTYDVILDVIGTLPWARAKAHLAKDGTLCLISADLMQNIGAKFRPRRSNGRRIVASITGERPDKMARLLDLYRKGTYRPVLGAVFRFADIRKAHKLVEGFSKPGTVILEMGQP